MVKSPRFCPEVGQSSLCACLSSAVTHFNSPLFILHSKLSSMTFNKVQRLEGKKKNWLFPPNPQIVFPSSFGLAHGQGLLTPSSPGVGCSPWRELLTDPLRDPSCPLQASGSCPHPAPLPPTSAQKGGPLPALVPLCAQSLRSWPAQIVQGAIRSGIKLY